MHTYWYKKVFPGIHGGLINAKSLAQHYFVSRNCSWRVLINFIIYNCGAIGSPIIRHNGNDTWFTTLHQPSPPFSLLMSSHNLLYDFIEKEKANVSLISTWIPINHPTEIYQIFVEMMLIRVSYNKP